MSFLVASGHVEVTAQTRQAKEDIDRLIDSLRRAGTEGGRAFERLDSKAKTFEKTLGRIKALGDLRIRAELDGDAGAGLTAIQAQLRDIKRESPVQLRARFSGDTAQLAAMAQAMRDLREDTTRTGTPLTALTARSTAAAAALQALDNAAQDAARSLRTLRGRAAATAAAMGDLRDTTGRAATALNTFGNRAQTVDGRLTTLSGNSRTLRGDMDDLDGSLRRVGGSMGGLRGSLGGLGGSGGGAGSAAGMQSLTRAALMLSPALIPVAATLTAIAVKAAAAGAGVAAFAVAAAGQIKDLTEASEAASKYDKAVAEFGRNSAEASKAAFEQQRILKTMPPATQEAAASLSVLKDEYRAWSDALAADTMPVVTKSLGLFQAMLPRLTPIVRSTSAELNNLMNVLAGGMQTQGFERFMDKLAGWAGGALADATRGLVKFSQALDTGAVNSDLEQFMDYARANGPLVGEAMGNLARALTHLVVAASDVGVSMLTVVNALAKMVNAIPTGVLTAMVQLAAGLKLVQLGAAGLVAVTSSTALARVGAFFTLMRTAGVGPTLSAAAGSMTRFQKAALGLGVIGAVAIGIGKLAEEARGAPPDVDRLTTSLKNLATTGQFSGELKKQFGDMQGLVEDIGKLGQATKEQEEYVKSFGNAGIKPLDDLRRKAYEVWDSFKDGGDSVKALDDKFKALDSGLASMVSSGQAQQAAQLFAAVKKEALAQGKSLEEVNKAVPQYRDSMASLKAEQDLAAQGMGIFGQQAIATKQKLDAQKASADGLRQSILALNDTNRAAYDSQIAFEAGIDALTASFKEHGATLNLDTAAGQANGQAMSAAAKAHDEMLAASIAAGDSLGSMTSESEKLRSTMMRLATDAFDGNKKKAQEYVNTLLGTPKSITTLIKAEKAEALTGLQAVQAAIKATPGSKSVKVDTLNAAAIKALEAVGLKTKQLPDGQTAVYTANGQAIGSIGAVDKALSRLNGKTATTHTNHYVTTRFTSIYTVKKLRPGDKGYGVVAPGMGGASGGLVPGGLHRFASGGGITGQVLDGPGTKTSDSLIARLSRGEFVMRAAAVDKYGERFMAAVNEGRLPKFAKGGKLSASEKEGRKALTSDVTFTTAGKLAGYKNTETIHDLGMPDSVGSLVTSINSYLSNIKKAFSGKQESALVSQMTKSGKALLDNQKKLEGVNKALEGAKGKLDDLKGKFDSLKTSVSSSLVSFGNITKIGKYGTSPDALIKQLSSDTSRTTEFAKQLEALKGKGLNAEAISQIAQAGVTGGGMATAQSLLNATPDQIAKINALQAQLQKSADAAGTTTADAMYGAGIRAAEGLVKGLTAQQSAIEAAMMNIAKAMEASLKKALGIKSPAKRMMPIGDFTAQGVEAGWTKRLAKGNTLLSGSTAGLRVRPALMPGTPAAPAAAGPVSITVNIHSTDLLRDRAEQKRVANVLVKDMNDALLDYQKARRR